jgi:hypothetical protein
MALKFFVTLTAGKDGDNGSPGEPGISVWKVEGSTPEKILIPPRYTKTYLHVKFHRKILKIGAIGI